MCAFSTLGSGSNEEARIATLLSQIGPEIIPFERKRKLRSFRHVFKTLWRTRPDLVVMEGSGVAGGAALMLARLLAGVPYVVSSGDAIGPWVARHARLAGPLFHVYERLLCRFAAGFIGWTPYLAGRAMTLGSARAMTAPGFAPFVRTHEELSSSRQKVRTALGIGGAEIVFGIVGSLVWNRRVKYCYGLELIEALHHANRADVRVVIVGDGSGMARLRERAADRFGKTILLPGRVPQEQVPDYLSAMDVASLPQSVDPVGMFRYTTKISEYLAAGVPIVIGQIPAAYDLDDGWMWRLPGRKPWDPVYVRALARLMDTVTPAEIAAKRVRVPRALAEFDVERQIRRTTSFVNDIIDGARASRR